MTEISEKKSTPTSLLQHPKEQRQKWEIIRKGIAGMQIFGGLALSMLTGWIMWKGSALPGWYLMLVQGFSFTFLVAGWLLWSNDRRGFVISLAAQALQVVQLSTPFFAWALIAGPHVTAYLSANGPSADIGVNATVTLVIGRLRGLSIGINFLAVAALVCLVHMRARAKSTSLYDGIGVEKEQIRCN